MIDDQPDPKGLAELPQVCGHIPQRGPWPALNRSATARSDVASLGVHDDRLCRRRGHGDDRRRGQRCTSVPLVGVSLAVGLDVELDAPCGLAGRSTGPIRRARGGERRSGGTGGPRRWCAATLGLSSRWLGTGRTPACASTPAPEVGAHCGNPARWDLCRGAARKGGPYRNRSVPWEPGGAIPLGHPTGVGADCGVAGVDRVAFGGDHSSSSVVSHRACSGGACVGQG